jgi:small-conductance mechanosensitive channel
MPEDLLQRLTFEASQNWELKVLLSIATIAATLLVKWITVRVVRRNVADPTIRLVWTQIVNGTIALIFLAILSWVWLRGVGSILALLTLVAAAMTIVHKELIQNFTSWSVIAWRGLFKLGDHIEVGSHTGRVTDLGPMYFTLNEATGVDTGLRPTGRTVRVPNALVLTNPVINYSDQGQRWVDVEFALASDANWELGAEIIEDIIKKESETTQVDVSKPKDLAVTVQVRDSRVVLTAHYPTKPGDRLSSQTRVTRQIVKQFSDSELRLV